MYDLKNNIELNNTIHSSMQEHEFT